ncbi:FMN-binding protein [Nonomuraea sp. NPDC052265]|uniref:FMN-binding protein n=1 Tax=Nonomuraea sp. NPDC052265 TaxID=3364374 RepID=UPI0037C94316
MRRALFAILVTAVGLVLLLSFKPHELTAVASPPSAVSPSSATSQAPAGEPFSDGRQQDLDDGDRQAGIGRSAPLPGRDGAVPQAGGSWSGPGAAAGATSGDKVVTGDAADTRWGPVQVELILSGGRMAGIRVLQAPDGNHRDLTINSQALPTLNDRALAARSAEIDAVSGATYTSEGYVRSLQSALDRAGL